MTSSENERSEQKRTEQNRVERGRERERERVEKIYRESTKERDSSADQRVQIRSEIVREWGEQSRRAECKSIACPNTHTHTHTHTLTHTATKVNDRNLFTKS